MSKNIKRMFLFITLLFLCISIVNAEQVSNDTVHDSLSTTGNVHYESTVNGVSSEISEKHSNEKILNKKENDVNVKTSSKAYDVYDYYELNNALSTTDYDNVTVNIRSDITAKSTLYFETAIKKLTINGNGHTYNGNNSFNFLEINKNSIVKINNIVIRSCKDNSVHWSIIYNEGDLTINNVNFTKNNCTHHIIDTRSNLKINNTKFIDNDYIEGILAYDTNITIENSVFDKNICSFMDISTSHSSVLLKNIRMSKSYIFATGKLTIQSSILNDSRVNTHDMSSIINSTICNNNDEYSAVYGSGNLSLINSTFTGCVAEIEGGAINHQGNLTIIRSKFYNNTVLDEFPNLAGAVYSQDGIVTIKDSTFSHNNVTMGGAIALSNSTLYINNSKFENNHAKAYSNGNIYTGGSKTLINNSRFVNGGVHIESKSASITNTIFNKAPLEAQDIKIVNVTVQSNKTKRYSLSYVNASIVNSSFRKCGPIIVPDDFEKIVSDLNIINSVFEENMGEIRASSINIKNTTFNKIKSDDGVIIAANAKISNSKFTNNVQDNAGPRGIINLRGNSSIINTLFENNTSINGVIFNEYGNLSLKNSNFTNNSALEGGTISNREKVTVNHCIFKNNSARMDGGTILNDDLSYLTIKNSILKNSTSQKNGGAIYNKGILTLHNVTLTKNYAKEDGGAIYSFLDDYRIYNSRISYNKAGKNGGAIYGLDQDSPYNEDKDSVIQEARRWYLVNSNILSGNNISYNKAGKYGGAIYQVRFNNNIKSNIFLYNQATKGSAIYTNFEYEYYNITGYNTEYNLETGKPYRSAMINGQYKQLSYGNTTINNNTFIKNKAKVNNTSAIVINGTNNTLKNNKNNQHNLYSSTIHIIGLNNTIINNIFDDGRNNTKIMINRIQNKIYNDNVSISGKISDIKGKVLKNIKIKINYYGKSYTTKTDTKGVYNKTIKASKTGTNNITVIFEGDSTYYPSSNKTTFKVIKQDTRISVNKITATQYKDNITIKGTLTDKNGLMLKNIDMKINLNGKAYTTKTDTKGIYSKTIKATIPGKNNVTVTFKGNTNYKTSNASTTFTVLKQTTKLTILTISQKTYKENVTILGKLSDKTGSIIRNATVKVKVNTKTYTARTNSKGLYSLKIVANKVGTNNVTVTYAGDKYYKAVTKKTNYKTVARATKLTVNKINTTSKAGTVKITGKLSDNLKAPVMNSLVKVKVNTKTVSVKTNKDGVYSYNYRTTISGTNNVTVTFPGSMNYKASNVKTSFIVQ